MPKEKGSLETYKIVTIEKSSAPRGLTDAEVAALGLRANILPYPAETIVKCAEEFMAFLLNKKTTNDRQE